METKMRKFTRTLSNYGTERKRFFLRLWYRNAMNFIHENYKKLNLVEFNADKKKKMIFFYKWRQAFLKNRKNFDNKTESIKILKSFVD